jgi:hypothetical protein
MAPTVILEAAGLLTNPAMLRGMMRLGKISPAPPQTVKKRRREIPEEDWAEEEGGNESMESLEESDFILRKFIQIHFGFLLKANRELAIEGILSCKRGSCAGYRISDFVQFRAEQAAKPSVQESECAHWRFPVNPIVDDAPHGA